MQELIRVVTAGWPNRVSQVAASVRPFWSHKDSLSVVDDSVLIKRTLDSYSQVCEKGDA